MDDVLGRTGDGLGRVLPNCGAVAMAAKQWIEKWLQIPWWVDGGDDGFVYDDGRSLRDRIHACIECLLQVVPKRAFDKRMLNDLRAYLKNRLNTPKVQHGPNAGVPLVRLCEALAVLETRLHGAAVLPAVPKRLAEPRSSRGIGDATSRANVRFVDRCGVRCRRPRHGGLPAMATITCSGGLCDAGRRSDAVGGCRQPIERDRSSTRRSRSSVARRDDGSRAGKRCTRPPLRSTRCVVRGTVRRQGASRRRQTRPRHRHRRTTTRCVPTPRLAGQIAVRAKTKGATANYAPVVNDRLPLRILREVHAKSGKNQVE